MTASQIFNEKKTLLQFGMLEFHSLVRSLHEYHNQKMTHDDCLGMHFLNTQRNVKEHNSQKFIRSLMHISTSFTLSYMNISIQSFKGMKLPKKMMESEFFFAICTLS